MSGCHLQTNRKHCRLCKVLSLFQNISVTHLGQKRGKKQFECGEFVAWTPDTTEIVHAVYWASSVCSYCRSLLSKLCCTIITTNLQYLPAMRLQSLCATWTLVQGRTSGWLLWAVTKGTRRLPLAHRQARSEINDAGGTVADSHQHKSPSLGSWNVTFHT